ncbi:MAG: dTMP kinase [Patescibacteria group bacterium]
MLIMIDGIDGSGKSTIVAVLKEYLTGEGNAIFDLRDYWLANGKYPEFHELKSYDFIFTSEPTYIGIGKVLREELINSNNHYPEKAIAHAFSLDRIVLYNKIIIPALKEKKCVISDRGVSTSLCYQTLSGKLSIKEIAEMVGNSLALEYAPEHLIIMKVNPKEALARLKKRSEKQDNAVFEKLAFQTKAADLFYSKEYKKLFEAHGTKVHYLPGNDKIDIMKTSAIKLFKQILTK